MLYCSTSSQYRTAFLQVVSCGRLRARGHRGHAEASVGGRGFGLSRSFRGCSDVGLETSSNRPAASLVRASGTFSGTGNLHFRTGDKQNSIKGPLVAASAPGSMTLHFSECSNSGHQKVSNFLEVPIELRSLRGPSSSHKSQVNTNVGLAVKLDSNGLSLSTLSSKLAFPDPSEDSKKARNKPSNGF